MLRYSENLQGTAFPSCLYIDEIEPTNSNESGNVWILAHSRTVNLLFREGWL